MIGTEFDDLESDLNAPAANPHKAIAPKPLNKLGHPEGTFPCQSCAGTGKYRGVRVHQPETKCFPCNGRGWFKKPQRTKEQRMAAKAAYASKKQAKLDKAKAAFTDANEQLVADLRALATWHRFSQSLLAKLDQYGYLTDNQVELCKRIVAEQAAKQVVRDADKAAKSGSVDVSKIDEMFARVASRGLKRPRFWCGPLVISMAPAHGANAGGLYVRHEGVYVGKIVRGTFMARREAPADTLAKLVQIAADPMGTAVAHGKLTGNCACCGRQLTDPKSVEMGIGPVCADKWF